MSLMIESWFFFFSSRRRHTRFKCDWSSDVCSSDLATCRSSEHFCGRWGTSLLFARIQIRACDKWRRWRKFCGVENPYLFFPKEPFNVMMVFGRFNLSTSKPRSPHALTLVLILSPDHSTFFSTE